MESKGKKYYNAQQQIQVNKEDIEDLQTLTKTHTSQIDTLEKAIVSGYKYLEVELTQQDDNTFTGELTEEQIATLESGVPIGFYAHLIVKSVDAVQIFLTQYSKETEETEEGESITYYKYTGYRDGVNYTALINFNDLSITFSGVVAELDYDSLSNKPTIEKVELSGDKSFADLGLDAYYLTENLIEGSSYVVVDVAEGGDKVIVNLDQDFLSGIISAEENLTSHIKDSDIHVTSEEKSNWNSHIEDSDIHVTSEEKTTWNNAVQQVTTATTVYGVDGDSKQYSFPINVEPNKYSVAYRDGTGGLKVATPTLDAHATTKSYVDTKYSVQTSAPESAIEDGGIHIVHLASEPDTKYDGYIYLIDEE